jgi:hypothetical protein
MTSIIKLWETIDKVVNGQRVQPSAVIIPQTNVLGRGAEMAEPFEVNKDYFEVRINQLFLKNERKWLTQIDPMVFVVSEFLYNKKNQIVPYVVGPGLVRQLQLQKVPQGMIFRNEKVAGLHPYRGGALTLTVVLCQIPVDSPAQALLGVIEKAAKAFDFATVLSTYITIGKVILEGIESLFGLNDTLPLVGLRTTFDPDAGDLFTPNYFALIDAANVNPHQLCVRDNQLLKANSMEPYNDADFVLYSVVRAPDRKRNDIEQLPFYEIWERAVNEAISLKDGSWNNAKGIMIELVNALYLSPDLTRGQVDSLSNEYWQDLKVMHDQTVKASSLSGSERGTQDDRLDDARHMANLILQD